MKSDFTQVVLHAEMGMMYMSELLPLTPNYASHNK